MEADRLLPRLLSPLLLRLLLMVDWSPTNWQLPEGWSSSDCESDGLTRAPCLLVFLVIRDLFLTLVKLPSLLSLRVSSDLFRAGLAVVASLTLSWLTPSLVLSLKLELGGELRLLRSSPDLSGLTGNSSRGFLGFAFLQGEGASSL